MPGLPKVLLLDSEALVWGGMHTSGAFHVNVSLVSYTSSLYNSSQHPGFDIKPLYWCANTNNMTPVSIGIFSTGTSAGLADSLAQISTAVEDDPAAAAFAFIVLTTVILVEQSLTVLDVVAGGGARLGLPLLLMGSPFPSQLGAPIPASLVLDLAGCLGCVSLTTRATHVNIIGLWMTGLERPMVSSGSSSRNSSDGTQLSLPLWAFQFNRSSGSPSVTLYNVTLTLPQEEFRLLLLGLTAGPGPGAGGGQQQLLSLQGNFEFAVCGLQDMQTMRECILLVVWSIMHDMGSLGRTLQIDFPRDWASLALHRDVWSGGWSAGAEF